MRSYAIPIVWSHSSMPHLFCSFCEHYTACYAVWDVDDSSNLSEECVDESAIGKAACQKACEKWECCWAENNCFAANNGKSIQSNLQHATYAFMLNVELTCVLTIL